MIVLIGFFVVGIINFSKKDEQKEEEIKKEALLARTPLEEWIDKLEKFECEGCISPYRRIDSNGLYSYGCFQFQEETFREQVRKYNLAPYADYGEIMNFIYDCDFQKRLTKIMLEDNYQNYLHWKTSVLIRGLGLPPKES